MVIKLRSGDILKIFVPLLLLLIAAISPCEVCAQDTDSEILLFQSDSSYTMALTGSEGWKMITSPANDLTFSDLGLRMQGLPGSAFPNSWSSIYYWDEKEGEFLIPRSTRESIHPAQGYMIYVFEDDELKQEGIQGGFPKSLKINRPIQLNNAHVELTATDHNDNGRIDGKEGWNLIANPFATEISVAKVIEQLQQIDQHVSPHVWVWKPDAGNGNGQFIILREGSTLAPLQSFWVRYLTPGLDAVFPMDHSMLEADQRDRERDLPNLRETTLKLKLSRNSQYDSYNLTFSEEGSIDMDYGDAFKLFSMKEDALNLFGSIGGSSYLALNMLPDQLDARMEIPIHFTAEEEDRGEFTFTWEDLEDLPAGWQVMLTDKASGTQIDLRNNDRYSFYHNTDVEPSPAGDDTPDLFEDDGIVSRFLLTIDPGTASLQTAEEQPQAVQFNPNYPNPFNPTTTISFELQERAHITLSVWNYVGQKVATLIDEVREVGEHRIVWNAANMPSGFYIAKLEIGEKTFVRKMTLIK